MIIWMMNLNKAYWDKKYDQNKLVWDLGHISPPLKAYIDQLTDKNTNILIPGAGNGYEVEYLFKAGYTNLQVVDISAHPLNNIKTRIPDFPEDHLIPSDFFELKDMEFDLILEQTFFCSLPPEQRTDYAKKMYDLLAKDGRLVGLLFDRTFIDGPPFGGSEAEYRNIFEGVFKIKTLETAFNSIKPRKGKELFFIFEK